MPFGGVVVVTRNPETYPSWDSTSPMPFGGVVVVTSERYEDCGYWLEVSNAFRRGGRGDGTLLKVLIIKGLATAFS